VPVPLLIPSPVAAVRHFVFADAIPQQEYDEPEFEYFSLPPLRQIVRFCFLSEALFDTLFSSRRFMQQMICPSRHVLAFSQSFLQPGLSPFRFPMPARRSAMTEFSSPPSLPVDFFFFCPRHCPFSCCRR